MARYLFFINQLYGYSILRPLQTAIRRRGDDCAWCTVGVDDRYLSSDENRLAGTTEVQAYAPDAVFVPGRWVPDFFPGAKVQVFHGLANDLTGKKGHFKVRGMFDLYCTHGEQNTRIFRRLAERYGTFHVEETGWPKLDPLFLGDSGDLRDELGATRPVVLFASTFSPSLTAAPHLVETIAELASRGDWQWLVTLHPKNDAEVFARYRALEGPNLRFADGEDVLALLKTADVMLCDTSSISLEFMMLDRPVVTFRTKVPGPHVLDVRSTSEIGPALARALERPESLLRAARAYVDELHPYRDGRSSERVLEATDRFLSEWAGKLKPKPLNLWRKLQMRNRLGYYRLR